MKKRLILSILLALTILCSMLVTGVASAPVAGDVDGNGKIEASDARLVLRFSVSLGTLTSQQQMVADVDTNAGITAADARLILRASVNLETLTLKQKTFNGHIVNSDCIGIETGIVCSDPDCCGETLVPSFNDLVNVLKAQGSLNRQYSFSKSVEVTEEPEITGLNSLAIKALLKDSFESGTVTEYSEFVSNRHINSTNFYVFGESYVSALEDGDIESITMTKMDGVDFVKNLPDSYIATASGSTVSLKSIKNSDIGEVYKVSVVLKPESLSPGNVPTEVSPIEKIIRSDYNDGFKKNFDELDNMFADIPEFQDFIEMDMKVTTDCTVDYYFTADTFEPVCARYLLKLDMDTITTLKMGIVPDKITINATTTQDSYYFFNNHFTVE